jgi:hypothetical protein
MSASFHEVRNSLEPARACCTCGIRRRAMGSLGEQRVSPRRPQSGHEDRVQNLRQTRWVPMSCLRRSHASRPEKLSVILDGLDAATAKPMNSAGCGFIEIKTLFSRSPWPSSDLCGRMPSSRVALTGSNKSRPVLPIEAWWGHRQPSFSSQCVRKSSCPGAEIRLAQNQK